MISAVTSRSHEHAHLDPDYDKKRRNNPLDFTLIKSMKELEALCAWRGFDTKRLDMRAMHKLLQGAEDVAAGLNTTAAEAAVAAAGKAPKVAVIKKGRPKKAAPKKKAGGKKAAGKKKTAKKAGGKKKAAKKAPTKKAGGKKSTKK